MHRRLTGARPNSCGSDVARRTGDGHWPEKSMPLAERLMLLAHLLGQVDETGVTSNHFLYICHDLGLKMVNPVVEAGSKTESDGQPGTDRCFFSISFGPSDLTGSYKAKRFKKDQEQDELLSSFI